MPETSTNPLHSLHEQADAEFQSYGAVEIVSTFGQPQLEYAALHKRCGLMDLPQRGILQVAGKDRLDFLNRFLTHSLIDKESRKPLEAGQGTYAFLLNNKGRIVADMNVLERREFTFLETDARIIPELKSTLEKYIFTEKVEFSDQTGKLHEIALHGPHARQILSELLPNGEPEFPPLPVLRERDQVRADENVGPQAPKALTLTLSQSTGRGDQSSQLQPLQSVESILFDQSVVIWRDDPTGRPGYFLILPADSAGKIWSELLARFGQPDPSGLQQAIRRLRPVGWAAFNSTRIEAGRALFGIDFDSTVLPAETSELSRAVSFTKGCYLGQEIVARMHARGQAARHIVGFRMETDALPSAGAPVFDAESNNVGIVTSSTIAPILSNAAIGLAMVKKTFAEVGSILMIAAEGAIRRGTVVPLPFVNSANPTEKSP